MYFEYKETGTKYWHRHLYYPDGLGEVSDKNLDEIINENRYSLVQEEYW